MKNSSNKNFLVFIDIKSAFNKVNHEHLFKKLEKLNLGKDTLNIIKLIFSNITLKLGKEEIYFNAGTP